MLLDSQHGWAFYLTGTTYSAGTGLYRACFAFFFMISLSSCEEDGFMAFFMENPIV